MKSQINDIGKSHLLNEGSFKLVVLESHCACTCILHTGVHTEDQASAKSANRRPRSHSRTTVLDQELSDNSEWIFLSVA